MTCKDCIHSGLCYKENDYENFPDRCGEFISDKVLEERPQGEFVKMLNERIEKGVCKWCQMNKLCEISRVFMIIELTDKEMKGGAE